jgi:DNA anti-recombination protein RmuC
MSVSGYEPGSIRARLDALKKSGKDRRDQAISKLDEAGKKHEEVSAEIERVAGQIEKEAADALQEFAEFSNGGPA